MRPRGACREDGQTPRRADPSRRSRRTSSRRGTPRAEFGSLYDDVRGRFHASELMFSIAEVPVPLIRGRAALAIPLTNAAFLESKVEFRERLQDTAFAAFSKRLHVNRRSITRAMSTQERSHRGACRSRTSRDINFPSVGTPTCPSDISGVRGVVDHCVGHVETQASFFLAQRSSPRSFVRVASVAGDTQSPSPAARTVDRGGERSIH